MRVRGGRTRDSPQLTVEQLDLTDDDDHARQETVHMLDYCGQFYYVNHYF